VTTDRLAATAVAWSGLVGSLPAPAATVQTRDAQRSWHLAARRHVVILDDDPTGSQAVHDVPVLTSWLDDDLRWAFAHPGRAFFVLTNSRSLPSAEAEQVLTEIDRAVARIAAQVGTEAVVVSRGDSTLRGHFPLETDVLARGAAERGSSLDAVVLVPAYLEAGRVTVDDVHYARSGDEGFPVGLTDYARDEAFGYASSDLRDWVEEKTESRVRREDVISVSLHDIRVGGADAVVHKLLMAHDGAVVIVNAVLDSDLDVVCAALRLAEESGWRAVYRTGPSMVAALLGLRPSAPLLHEDIIDPHRSGDRGLVVVGSHVELSTRQVQRLLATDDVVAVEVDVVSLVDPGERAVEVARCLAACRDAARHADVVLLTSRTVLVTAPGQSSLALSRLVASVIVTLVQELTSNWAPAWVVAKGGITSHEVATGGLGIHRAIVLGQLFPGLVSVWRSEAETGREDHRPLLEGLPYVVFAGNVGDTDSLRDCVLTLRGSAHA
jgi:uncharacterized protein YgbK (DUF1537 family)